MNETRRVIVLAEFTDANGEIRKRGEIMDVAYATERQRRAVNERVYRSYLSFDIEQAQAYLTEQAQAEEQPETTPRGRRRAQ